MNPFRSNPHRHALWICALALLAMGVFASAAMFEWNDVKVTAPDTAGRDVAPEMRSDNQNPRLSPTISSIQADTATNAQQNLGLVMALAGLVDIPEEIRQYNQAVQNRFAFADPRDVFGKNWAQREPLLFPPVAAPQYRSPNAESFYELAFGMAANAEKSETALRRYNEAISRVSALDVPQDKLYNILMRGGLRQEHAGQKTRGFPATAEACHSQGNTLVSLGKLREAADFYREALRLKPDYAEACNNLGNVLSMLGENQQALAQYQEAVRLKPDYSGAHSNLGNVLAAIGQPAEAVKHYEKALRGWPDSADIHNNLGEALMLLGRVPEAILQFREALRLNPDFTDARVNLEKALGAGKQ